MRYPTPVTTAPQRRARWRASRCRAERVASLRITFDYQIFGAQVRGGISRYFVELARNLAALESSDVEILAPVYINAYLRRSGRGLLAPHGATHDWLDHAAAAGPSCPFILFVGSRDTYKNFDGVLRAYSLSPRLRRDFALVAFGGGSFTAGERVLAAELGIPEDKLLQLGGDDATLVALYRQARVCVYPSQYEGFGFIPLEAMTFGCPVVTTHRGSLKEVVAGAAEIVDPGEPESIAAGLATAAFDEARRAPLRTAGVAPAAPFTWERCATG